MLGMATSVCANTATAASSLLQRSSVIRSGESASSSKLGNLAPWQSKSLRGLSQGFDTNRGSRIAQERRKGNAAVRATITAYRDLDSVSAFPPCLCSLMHSFLPFVFLFVWQRAAASLVFGGQDFHAVLVCRSQARIGSRRSRLPRASYYAALFAFNLSAGPVLQASHSKFAFHSKS